MKEIKTVALGNHMPYVADIGKQCSDVVYVLMQLFRDKVRHNL